MRYRRAQMKWYFQSGILLCALLLAGCANPGGRTFDFGFAAARLPDIRGETHFTAAGPFYESAERKHDFRYLGVRPLFSRVSSPADARWSLDVLWPLAAARGWNDDFVWRFLLAYGMRYGDEQSERYRTWLLPVWFQGRTAAGEDYFAVFPLGGKICEFLGRDRISFVLFPLYARSVINEVRTTSILWPVGSRTKGDKISRFRVFPFYGYSRLLDEYEKRFILWPVWTSARYYHEGGTGRGYVLFPLWGRLKLEDQESWMLLPPFFRWHRGQKRNVLHAPWPFFQKTSGDVDKLYLWPLWGRREAAGVKTGFFLWPVFGRRVVDRQDTELKTLLAMPFLTWEKETEKTEEQAVTARWFSLWPLCSYRREGDESRFRLLHLFPGRHIPPVERNWAPFWTLYSRQRIGDERQSELLWGLYRSRKKNDAYAARSLFPLAEYEVSHRDGNRFEWSVLKGLIGYKRVDETRSLRLFYLLKLGGKERQP
ncbi:MAG: hypothetical protein PHD86_04185 [Kiritimatiellae bacterium]|nr:hypothetical protein [Kiritimatiellia bacterium]